MKAPPVAEVFPLMTTGAWVAHSLKYPTQMIEMTLSAEQEAVGERRAIPSNQRLFRHSTTAPGKYQTTRFSLESNDGNSTVYDRSYVLKGREYHGLPKAKVKKDHYQGLVLDYTPDRLTVAQSEVRMLKVYSGNFFVPLREGPLFRAIRAGDVTGLDLSDMKLDEPSDSLARTPLYQAASLGHIAVVKALLEAGASVDACNSDRFERTPLFAAVQQSKLDILKVLIDAGANVNFQDTQGRTALHVAADSCGEFRQLVRRLLTGGADRTLTSQRGETVEQELQRRSKHFLSLYQTELAKLQL
ncbi:ankyrin repeat domain-containing protein [Coraliomargarita sp. W4R53]